MMYSEFIEKAEIDRLDWTDWCIVETVYSWSSTISEDYTGKDEIVRLFKLGGMKLMKALLPEAKLNREIDRLQNIVNKLYYDKTNYESAIALIKDVNYPKMMQNKPIFEGLNTLLEETNNMIEKNEEKIIELKGKKDI